MYSRPESALTDAHRLAGIQVRGCCVREMRSEDVVGTAMLHRAVFPDYFLTHMGQRFLERFYSEFIERNGNYGFVAIQGKTPVGSVLGTDDYGRCFTRFYRRHLLSSALTLAGRFAVDPHIRRNLATRLAHVRRALQSVVPRRPGTVPPSDPATASGTTASLLSIAVRPELRGSGLAEVLVDRLCEAMWQDGLAVIELSVRTENQRAIAFYEKSGWRRVGTTTAMIRYNRSTRPKPRAGGE